MPPDAAAPCPLPLRGRDRVKTPDVFVLTSPDFWLRRHLGFDPVYAVRQRLVVGFCAFAGFKSPTMCRIEFADCFPEQRLIRMKFSDDQAGCYDVPITRALALLLGEYMEVRPAGGSTRLFATTDGPIVRGTLDHGLWSAGKVLGVGRELSSMLCAYFEANLTGKKAVRRDIAAIEAYGRRRMAQDPHVTFAALRDLIDRTDPFEGDTRPFGEVDFPRRRDLFADSPLPATYDACLPREKFGGQSEKAKLPATHPLIAALSSVIWPKQRRQLAATSLAIYKKHQPEIDRLVSDGVLPLRQLASLFKMRKESFVRFRRKFPTAPKQMTGVAPTIQFADPTVVHISAVAALMLVRWSKNREERAIQRKPLFAKWSKDIELLVAQERLLMKEADALFGMKRNGFKNRLKRSKMEPRPAAPPHWALRDCSVEEQARVDGLKRLVWPVGDRLDKFHDTVLLKHGDFVFRLVNAKKMRVATAAALLHLSRPEFLMLRTEHKAGTLNLLLFDDQEQDRGLWREIVLRELDSRPDGQGDLAFCIDLRKRLGLRLPFDFVRTIVRAAQRQPAPPKHIPAAVPVRTPEEEARIELISSTRWAKRDKAKQRRVLLRDHVAWVFEMIDARKLSMKDSQRLFRCPRGLMTEMRSDWRDGVLEWAFQETPPPEERAEWLTLVRRELCKRPDGQTPNEFCRSLRKRFGFPLPFAAVNQIMARERKQRPDDASLFTPKPGRVKPPLSSADKVCLRSLSKVNWSEATDVDQLQRELLTKHFPAVATMMAEWKLNAVQAARLFRMTKERMWHILAEYRNGTFDLVIAPPPSAEEHARSHRIVVEGIAERCGDIANVTEFWRTMRKEKRIRLPLATVRRLLKAFHERRKFAAAIDRAA